MTHLWYFALPRYLSEGVSETFSTTAEGFRYTEFLHLPDGALVFETDYDSWHDESYIRPISVILLNNVLSHRCQGSIDGLFFQRDCNNCKTLPFVDGIFSVLSSSISQMFEYIAVFIMKGFFSLVIVSLWESFLAFSSGIGQLDYNSIRLSRVQTYVAYAL